MFHPYIAQLLAAERRRDYLQAARASRTAAGLRRPNPRLRRLGIGGYRLRFALRRTGRAQLGAECGP